MTEGGGGNLCEIEGLHSGPFCTSPTPQQLGGGGPFCTSPTPQQLGGGKVTVRALSAPPLSLSLSLTSHPARTPVHSVSACVRPPRGLITPQRLIPQAMDDSLRFVKMIRAANGAGVAFVNEFVMHSLTPTASVLHVGRSAHASEDHCFLVYLGLLLRSARRRSLRLGRLCRLGPHEGHLGANDRIRHCLRHLPRLFRTCLFHLLGQVRTEAQPRTCGEERAP